MKRSVLIALTAALLAALPAGAQSSTEPGLNPFPPATVVSITGHLAPVQPGTPPLPFDLLAQLERDRYLAGLRTEPRAQTGPGIVLTYSFPNVEAYRTWSETPQTRELLGVLRQRISQFELTVSLTRSPIHLIEPGSQGQR